MPNWTQDQAIAFECAREVITHMMAIQTGLIASETEKTAPSLAYLESLRAKRSQLAQERSCLHVEDDAEIARVLQKYGAIVRDWRKTHHVIAA